MSLRLMMTTARSAGRPRTARSAGPCAERGVSLIEVLIALVILSVGLLGLAGLQTTSLQFNTSAYYRTQATFLTYSLAERMRANRQGALAGDYDSPFEDPPPACDPAGVDGGTPAEDLESWRNEVACRLPLGTGSVEREGTEFVITVQWRDRGEEDPMTLAFRTAL